MVLQDDADRVKHLLAEAISVLCKNGLSFETELSVEGLLGITLDNSDIFLVNINETITTEGRKQQQKSSTKSRVSASRDKSPEDRHEKSPRDRQEKSPRDRHGRKRGRETQPTSPEPEPSAKRTTRAGRHSNVEEPINIKKEKLSVADDASRYGGDDDTHDDDTPEEMKCTRCGKMFDNPANLERHLKEIHFVGVVWLCCQNCDFSHVSMKHFNYHMFRLHRKVGGRKRFPQELKFLTPERIKYRIEHNMRVPDISDNMPRPAAEKSGPSSSSLRRTPARLSANASKRLEKPLVRTTEKPRVTIKAEPNGKSAPRSLRHRNGAGQVVIFSKDRKGSLRRRSAPPAPSTPRTAKPIPKPVPKVIPKPVTPKVIPKPTPKVTPRREEKKSTPRREEKKATPKRVEKIATPRREEKKATPKRDDRKKTPLSKDTKKTPTSSKKTDKPVVKKKPIVPPKKVEAKKSPFKEQKSVKRKSSSKKIIWPEGVSVKDFEIKLNPLDLAAIEAARKKPDAEVDKDLEKSGESPEKAAVEKALEILSKDDEQESPVSPEKSMETDVQVQSSTGTSTDETRPKAGTGETQSEATTGETDSTIKAASETDTNKSTGETDANTSTGEMDANKTTGETVANKSTGETDTSKTSETHPDASTGEPQPDISTDKTQPEASSGETQPKAGTGETQPDAGTTGETQQEEMSGETQLEEKTNETQTELSTSETQPDASSDETQSKMGTGETQPEVSTGKTQVERSTDEANAKESQEDGNAERGKEDKSSPTKTFEKDQELKDSQDQVSSEQVSSTTVEEKEPGSVDEGSGEGTEYSEREVEAVGSSEPMETNDIHAKDVETSENEVGKGEDSIDTGEKLPAEETMDDTEKEQVAIPDDDIEKDAGIEQDESIEQGDERAEDVDQGEKEDVDDADAEADSQRKGQGDEEMETDPVQDDAEMAAFSNGDDDNTNIVTDTRKQDEPIVSSLVPDQEKKGLSPRAKDIPAAPEHQFTPDEPIQRIAEDLMSDAAVMEPGGPVAPVLDQHVTSSQQSEHLGGDGEVDVAALLGEINTMNQ